MSYKSNLLKKINNKSAVVGIIGLGYVGLPLALAFAEKGFNVIGFDNDETKIPILLKGESYIQHIPSSRIKAQISINKFKATSDFTQLQTADCILICVPTPLDQYRQPDLSFVINSAKIIAQHLRSGQLIVLESSTYPGTTEEVLLPLLNQKFSTFGGDKVGAGNIFFLAFSPEREDPGNHSFNTNNIPKIVGGVTRNCLEVASKLYEEVVVRVVSVSSPRVAEAAKLLENIYRSVNIALVNELKMVFDKMGIDVWEVIEAAKTKPFGFQAFYPGPGLGGHCIPIDPFYLTWKAREYDINTKFIELAGEINTFQPYYVAQRVIEVLNNSQLSILNSQLLILGVSYKKNIDDMRESPSLKLIEIFESKGAKVDYCDPHVAKLYPMRKYNYRMKSIPVSSLGTRLPTYDIVLLSTDHDAFNYKLIAKKSKMIVDTRNAFEQRGIKSKNIFKA